MKKTIFYLFSIVYFFCIQLIANPLEDVVILGSGPAGLTAAIYTSRAGLSTLVLEGQEPGGQIGFSYSVENYPGFPEGINGYDLGQKLREQALRFNSRIQANHVSSIDLSTTPFIIHLDDKTKIFSKTLIIATGASVKWLDIESLKSLIGNGVSSCAVCDAFAYKNKEVIVVGGGDTALEDALFLTNYAAKVTIVHRKDHLKASPYLQKKAFASSKIHFIWNSNLEEVIDPTKGEVKGVAIRNTLTNERTFIPCEGVFIAIGHHPNTELFKNILELDEHGYILTKKSTTETSVVGVFAAGDVADSHYRQAITAAGTGCMAGIDVYHYIQKLDQKE